MQLVSATPCYRKSVDVGPICDSCPAGSISDGGDDECRPNGSLGSNSLCTEAYCKQYRPGGMFHSRCEVGDAGHDWALQECKGTCGLGGWCRTITNANVETVRTAMRTGNWVGRTGGIHLPTWEVRSGWPTGAGLLKTQESPCNVRSFVAKLDPGEGYYSDPSVAGGWCKRIMSGNVETVRTAMRTGASTSNEGLGKIYLPPARAR
jgi:hypothetical protein